MLRSLAFILLLLGTCEGFAQSGETIQQCLLDLSNDAVVMSISAHPDDEDGSTLAYYRRKLGVKTYSILFTRGEGGQNEIGPELYDELGVIRTQEMDDAGKILGTRVDFLNLPDFGYSKSATEAFRVWGGREEVLRRLVYFIRKYKPDILFTNHGTGGGHGHHQAVSVTAIAAFDAAADPAKFPEQFKLPGLAPWQPGKLYLRMFPSSGGRPEVSHQIGEIHVPSGESYLEIASRALREHRSQGMEAANLARFTGGVSLYRLARTNSAYPVDTTSFLGGISFSFQAGANSLRNIRTSLDSLTPGMSRTEIVDRCSRILSDIKARQQMTTTPREERILGQWREELENLAVTACEIILRVLPDDSIVVAGQKVVLEASVTSENCRVEISDIRLNPAPGWAVPDGADAVVKTGPDVWRLRIVPGNSAARTLPKVTQQYRPMEEDVLTMVEFQLTVDGRPLSVSYPLHVDVAPSLELSVSPRNAWLPISGRPHGLEFDYTIINRFPHKTAGTIDTEGPPEWKGTPESFLIEAEDGVSSGEINIMPAGAHVPEEQTIRFKTGQASTEAAVRIFDVKVSPGINLGIVKSYDTTLETVARDLDVPFTLLDKEDIASGDLHRFTSIVLDIRAYAVRADLRENNARLLEYVRKGGNLIVFYQKTQDWKKEYAPYPFQLTRDRITDEEAPVTILKPEHPLLTTPNVIHPEDWSGWVQERGVYFPGDVPPEYVRVLSTNDPDEPPLDTGLIVADFGSGSYLYTSYVWYRQMKEAHPGSIRCFANMISYPRRLQ